MPRAGPNLPGFFSVLALAFARRLRDGRRKMPVLSTDGHKEQEPTFSDAPARVRRLPWERTIFERAAPRHDFQKLPPKLKNLLPERLSRAA